MIPRGRTRSLWGGALLLGIVLGTVGACSEARRPLEGPNEGAIFPHAEAYATAAVHGLDARSLGSEACMPCHEQAGESAPTCSECHAAYPHSPGWERGAQHGGAFLSPSVGSEACVGCHGPELDGGISEVPCNSCHAAWPHPEDWANASVHAGWIASRSTDDACMACHAEQGPGSAEVPSCADCHAGYPHPVDWPNADAHGAAWLAGECGSCHGLDGRGGALAVGCRSCHASYPHPADWSSGHLAFANVQGEESCLSCHPSGFGPPLPTQSCALQCHSVQP